MFADKALGLFRQAKKDVMYDFLEREDINWRDFNLGIAVKVFDRHKLKANKVSAFVLDK